MPELKMFIPLTKIDEAKRLVYGIATGETPDSSLPSAEYLRGAFDYDPVSGVLCRRKTGKEVGFLRNDGYGATSVLGKPLLVHRIIWCLVTGEWPKHDVDHLNMSRADNRWGNLRSATRTQNRANTRAQRNSSHGIKGITWHNQHNKWLAQIMVRGKRKCLGTYTCPAAAHIAYVLGADRFFGNFARGA